MGEPVFNPFLKEWRNDGKPMHDRYEKPWGYTEYTKDGFAVNYDRNGHEIGRTKGSLTPSITGKTRAELQLRYFDIDKKLSDTTKVVAKRYGISPSLLASRMAKEFIDPYILDYNRYGNLFSEGSGSGSIFKYIFLGRGTPFRFYDDGWYYTGLYGLDDLPLRLSDGLTDIKEGWINVDTAGESKVSKWSDVVSLFGAELRSRMDQMRKKFPSMTSELLEAAASASFNRGEGMAEKYINNVGVSGLMRDYKPFIHIE